MNPKAKNARRAAALLCCFLGFGLAIRPGTTRAEDKPARTFQTIRNIEYAQRDADKLLADAYVPNGVGPFPSVLVVHGGAWSLGSKSQMSLTAETLAEHVYTALAINYRLAPKYPFPAQIEDCKSAVRFMRTHAQEYKIDPRRIAGYGYSAGGHLVCLLGTTDASCGLEGPDCTPDSPSTRLQCVVAGGAPCEFRVMPATSLQLAYWLGGTRADKPAAYELASPLKFVTKDDPPVFFYHGEQDSLVPLASPRAMAERLKSVGVQATVYVVPKAGHLAAFVDKSAAVAALKFLDQQLKPSAVTKSNQ